MTIDAVRGGAGAAARAESEGSNADSDDAALDMSHLHGMVGFMTRVVQLQIFQAFYDRFEQEGITTGSFSVLASVKSNPGVRQGALANAMLIKRSNMTKLVQSLERQGLIVRNAVAGDARAVSLDLTPEGHRLIDRILPEMVEFNRTATQALSVHERQILLALLGKLSEDWHSRRGSGSG